MIEGYNRGLIKHLLDLLARITWGSSTYVVKDRSIGVGQFDFEYDSMVGWFAEALTQGVTDLAEIEMVDRYSSEPLQARWLRAASDYSKTRRTVLQALGLGEKWKCAVLNLDSELSWFLNPFVDCSSNQAYDSNLVIVVKGYSKIQERRLCTYLDKSSSCRQRLIAWLDWRLPPGNLKDLCDAKKLKLIHCRGSYELRFLLCRLNGTSE